MSIKNLIAVFCIFACTSVAWFALGGALTMRTEGVGFKLNSALIGNWGPPLEQAHPSLHYTAPSSFRARREIGPAASEVKVELKYKPKRKGLMRYRTYEVEFDAQYVVKNPTPITQTIFFELALPHPELRYDGFELSVGGVATGRTPEAGKVSEAVRLGAGESVSVGVRYRTRGLGTWKYTFVGAARIAGFHLDMTTDFADYDIPAGSNSASTIDDTGGGKHLTWDYDGVINAGAIGMEMPKLLNPGPVAARITFFAPISLLFFFSVLTIIAAVKGLQLHPMHYFFLAAGCFVFQLLFVYLVDLIPAQLAFGVAAAVSLVLVCSYLWRVRGSSLARIGFVAQLAYMVLFSASFFFDGLTGITITIGSIATLALLMMMTARVDWEEIFKAKSSPKPAQPISVPLSEEASTGV